MEVEGEAGSIAGPQAHEIIGSAARLVDMRDLAQVLAHIDDQEIEISEGFYLGLST
jgi:hypothetical protein